MAWSLIPTRTSADTNSAADINQSQANETAIKGGTAATAPTKTLETVITETAYTSRTLEASGTLALADNKQLVIMNIADANTLTVPKNTTVDFPIGARVDVIQTGAGQTTITEAADVTVNKKSTLKITGQYSGCTLLKIAANTCPLE
jgi:hypothetical protein